MTVTKKEILPGKRPGRLGLGLSATYLGARGPGHGEAHWRRGRQDREEPLLVLVAIMILDSDLTTIAPGELRRKSQYY